MEWDERGITWKRDILQGINNATIKPETWRTTTWFPSCQRATKSYLHAMPLKKFLLIRFFIWFRFFHKSNWIYLTSFDNIGYVLINLSFKFRISGLKLQTFHLCYLSKSINKPIVTFSSMLLNKYCFCFFSCFFKPSFHRSPKSYRPKGSDFKSHNYIMENKSILLISDFNRTQQQLHNLMEAAPSDQEEGAEKL